jgi:hypothetical protein
MGFNPGVSLNLLVVLLRMQRVFGGIEFGFGTQVSSLQGRVGMHPLILMVLVLYPTLIFEASYLKKMDFIKI